MDMNRMGAVGMAAQASKKDAMKQGSEIFDGSVSVKKAEDGGFILSADYHREAPKGSKDPFPAYCPPKQYTAGSFDELVSKLRTLYGESGGGTESPAEEAGEAGGTYQAPNNY